MWKEATDFPHQTVARFTKISNYYYSHLNYKKGLHSTSPGLINATSGFCVYSTSTATTGIKGPPFLALKKKWSLPQTDLILRPFSAPDQRHQLHCCTGRWKKSMILWNLLLSEEASGWGHLFATALRLTRIHNLTWGGGCTIRSVLKE